VNLHRAIVALGLCFAVTSALALTASVAARPVVTVSIAGMVESPDGVLRLNVQAWARGTLASLAGKGMDTPIGIGPGECTVPLTGSAVGSVVTLSGAITQATDPSNLGVTVTFIADASTGSITFNFGGFVLEGTGLVVLNA